VQCANCGGELSGPTRFCPHCSAPQPGFEEPADEGPERAQLHGTPTASPPARMRRRWASHASAVLVFVGAAIVVFALMAFTLGWIGSKHLGL
jgi:hypothetical protein